MKKIIALIVITIMMLGGFFYFSQKKVSYHQKQAITELTCIKDKDYIPVIKGLGSGLIVTGSEEYNEKKEKNITHIRIADIMNDKVLYHLDMEGSYLLKDIYQNQIVIANFQLMELDFYDFELNKVSTLKVDDLAGYFL